VAIRGSLFAFLKPLRLRVFARKKKRSRNALLGEKAKIHFCKLNRQIRESLRLRNASRLSLGKYRDFT